MNRVLMASILTLSLLAPMSAAGKSTELTLSQIEANRRGIVKAVVVPTEQQAEDFWQTYWEYRGQVSLLNNRTVQVIDEFMAAENGLTADRAAALVYEVLDIESSRTDLKAEFVKRLKDVLRPTQVARWYQTERKMDSVIRADLAATIPFDATGFKLEAELTRTEIEDRREEFVKALVQPDPEQEKRFWYRYREYRQNLDKLGERTVDLIEEYAESYGSITEDQALRMAKEAANIDADRMARLQDIVRWQHAILTPNQMVRFLQGELKMNAVVDLELAALIPIDQ